MPVDPPWRFGWPVATVIIRTMTRVTANVYSPGFRANRFPALSCGNRMPIIVFFLSVSRESDRDTRFDALPLHMEEDDAYLGSVSYTFSNPFPFVESLQFSGYYNYVHHRMNNDHKPHRAGSGAGGGLRDGSGPGVQDGSGHPAGAGE